MGAGPVGPARAGLGDRADIVVVQQQLHGQQAGDETDRVPRRPPGFDARRPPPALRHVVVEGDDGPR